MIPARPTPRHLNLRSGDTLVTVRGWETTCTLGIYRTNGEGGYASCMLMGGYHLIDGFDDERQVHEFNKLVLSHPKLFVGTARIEEFHERAGGRSAAWNELVKLRAKAKEKQA